MGRHERLEPIETVFFDEVVVMEYFVTVLITVEPKNCRLARAKLSFDMELAMVKRSSGCSDSEEISSVDRGSRS